MRCSRSTLRPASRSTVIASSRSYGSQSRSDSQNHEKPRSSSPSHTNGLNAWVHPASGRYPEFATVRHLPGKWYRYRECLDLRGISSTSSSSFTARLGTSSRSTRIMPSYSTTALPLRANARFCAEPSSLTRWASEATIFGAAPDHANSCLATTARSATGDASTEASRVTTSRGSRHSVKEYDLPHGRTQSP